MEVLKRGTMESSGKVHPIFQNNIDKLYKQESQTCNTKNPGNSLVQF